LFIVVCCSHLMSVCLPPIKHFRLFLNFAVKLKYG
jgi:hypothetical protein